MRKQKTLLLLCNLFCCILLPLSAQKPATNPVIYADAPDMSMLRVGDTYYMSSTTMHMSPGVPIMKSNDLVNWKLVNYAYDTLANIPTMNLDDGKILMGVGRGRVVFAITRECTISPLSLRLRARHIFIPLKILKKVPGSVRNSLPLIMIILFSLMRTGIST